MCSVKAWAMMQGGYPATPLPGRLKSFRWGQTDPPRAVFFLRDAARGEAVADWKAIVIFEMAFHKSCESHACDGVHALPHFAVWRFK
jgi:hypothetical protein